MYRYIHLIHEESMTFAGYDWFSQDMNGLSVRWIVSAPEYISAPWVRSSPECADGIQNYRNTLCPSTCLFCPNTWLFCPKIFGPKAMVTFCLPEDIFLPEYIYADSRADIIHLPFGCGKSVTSIGNQCLRKKSQIPIGINELFRKSILVPRRQSFFKS